MKLKSQICNTSELKHIIREITQPVLHLESHHQLLKDSVSFFNVKNNIGNYCGMIGLFADVPGEFLLDVSTAL